MSDNTNTSLVRQIEYLIEKCKEEVSPYDWPTSYLDDIKKEAIELEATITRLREALEQIARNTHKVDHFYEGACNGSCAARIARAALAQDAEQENA